MRLFSTRARRPDRPPHLRPLDLAAVAASRDHVVAGVHSGRDAVVAGLAASMGPSAGVPPAWTAGDAGRDEEAPECGPHASVEVELGSLRVRISFDRRTRTAWLSRLLGLPAGADLTSDLSTEPSPLERTLFSRTLVAPIARAIDDRRPRPAAGPTAGESCRETWLSATERRPFKASEAFRLSASIPSGPVRILVEIARDDRSSEAREKLDRALRTAAVPLVVRLVPAAAGLSLIAGDLARFEPGDILLTDLPAAGGLPVELAGTSATGINADSSLLRGRMGLSGHRRAVRLEAWSVGNPSDR
jgi:hypothetical protein